MRKLLLNGSRPKEAVREIYDSLAARYDLKFRAMEWTGIHNLRKRLLTHARGEVLEVAVGTGINLPHYPQRCRVTGIDYSPKMIRRAKARARKEGMRANFMVMDAEYLGFRDGKFDTVVSTLSTNIFPNPVAAMREMGRVLRPDGIVLLLEQGYGASGWIRALQHMRARRQFELFGSRWEREPDRQAIEAGLVIEENSRHFFGCIHAMRLRGGEITEEIIEETTGGKTAGASPMAKPSKSVNSDPPSPRSSR